MRIAILGAGKMGSWLAKELAKENEVAIYDIDADRCKEAGVKALAGVEELEQYDPELLLNAVSLQNTVKAFGSASKRIGKDCILADVASIKGDIPEYYEGCGFRFVSVHPMFGPTFANVESLQKENAVIIKESDSDGKGFFRKFFERLGLDIFDYSFAEHDQMMAYSLTTPFAASLVFASCMENTAVPGATFARHLKIAKGLLSEEDNLLSEILFNKYSLSQIDKVTAQLEYLKHIIKGKDYDEAKKFFGKLRDNVGV